MSFRRGPFTPTHYYMNLVVRCAAAPAGTTPINWFDIMPDVMKATQHRFDGPEDAATLCEEILLRGNCEFGRGQSVLFNPDATTVTIIPAEIREQYKRYVDVSWGGAFGEQLCMMVATFREKKIQTTLTGTAPNELMCYLRYKQIGVIDAYVNETLAQTDAAYALTVYEQTAVEMIRTWAAANGREIVAVDWVHRDYAELHKKYGGEDVAAQMEILAAEMDRLIELWNEQITHPFREVGTQTDAVDL